MSMFRWLAVGFAFGVFLCVTSPVSAQSVCTDSGYYCADTVLDSGGYLTNPNNVLGPADGSYTGSSLPSGAGTHWVSVAFSYGLYGTGEVLVSVPLNYSTAFPVICVFSTEGGEDCVAPLTVDGQITQVYVAVWSENSVNRFDAVRIAGAGLYDEAPTATPSATQTPSVWMTPALTAFPCATGVASWSRIVAVQRLHWEEGAQPYSWRNTVTATVSVDVGTLRAVLDWSAADEPFDMQTAVMANGLGDIYDSETDLSVTAARGRRVTYHPYPDRDGIVTLRGDMADSDFSGPDTDAIVTWFEQTSRSCPAQVTPTITRTPAPIVGTAPNPFSLPTEVSGLVGVGRTPEPTSCVVLAPPSWPNDWTGATPAGPTATPSSGYNVCFVPQRITELRVASYDWLPFFNYSMIASFVIAAIMAIRRLRTGG